MDVFYSDANTISIVSKRKKKAVTAIPKKEGRKISAAIVGPSVRPSIILDAAMNCIAAVVVAQPQYRRMKAKVVAKIKRRRPKVARLHFLTGRIFSSGSWP
ncbi:hypothetical protein GWI33_008037 [Rhynchophorus ferrugineus]|uniref:Uncharacterized protein n=1 Tax=Rhynchophorus ferrugineus TaxID=354439 RepID=A0A834MHR0_RHYFE|nr:hypothetical protein GWI33_008037 [Rhynchophorus ferrugineus]